MGYSLWWLLLFCSTGSGVCGLQWLGCMDSVVEVLGLQGTDPGVWHVGLVVLQHVGSSWTRDHTTVPSIARWLLNHQTTREAL